MLSRFGAAISESVRIENHDISDVTGKFLTSFFFYLRRASTLSSDTESHGNGALSRDEETTSSSGSCPEVD